MTEAEIRENERERCALIAENLAERWERGADLLRKQHTRNRLFLGPIVSYEAERGAREIEAAANGLRAVAMCCRKGYDVRTAEKIAEQKLVIEAMQAQLTPEQKEMVAKIAESYK